MTRNRQHFAIAAVAVGVIVAIAGAAFTVSVWNAVQFVAATQLHDAYIVMPGMALLILFAVGVLGDIAFRCHAAKFAQHADLIWKAHLLVTSVLLIGTFMATSQSHKTWPMLIVVLATTPLMLVAHGVALAAGGLVVLRTNNPR